MNINSVYANVRLAVPDATLVEMNKYLLAEIDAINASGIESIRKYEIVYPVVAEYGTVSERKTYAILQLLSHRKVLYSSHLRLCLLRRYFTLEIRSKRWTLHKW